MQVIRKPEPARNIGKQDTLEHIEEAKTSRNPTATIFMKNMVRNVKTADGTNTKKVPMCQGERNA